MTELIIALLAIVIIGILTYIIYHLLERHTQQQNKLINALIAKNPDQMRDLTLADKVAPIKPQEQSQPDMIPETQLSEEDFDRAIQDELANG